MRSKRNGQASRRMVLQGAPGRVLNLRETVEGKQPLPAGFIEADAFPSGEKDPAFGTAVAVNFADAVDIHNGRTLEGNELIGIGFRFEGLDAFAGQVVLSVGVVTVV